MGFDNGNTGLKTKKRGRPAKERQGSMEAINSVREILGITWKGMASILGTTEDSLITWHNQGMQPTKEVWILFEKWRAKATEAKIYRYRREQILVWSPGIEDYVSVKTRYDPKDCENPDCPLLGPFIPNRKEQRFCSNRCAVIKLNYDRKREKTK